jgi:hypothetical protein
MNKPAIIPRLLFLIGTIHWFLFASAHSMIVDIDFVLGMHSPLGDRAAFKLFCGGGLE